MHQKFKTAAVVLVVAVATCNRAVEAGDVASGDNRHTFEALCAIFRAAEATVEVPATSVDPQKLYQYIQKLNMSVATKTWQDMFVSKPDPLELHTDPTKASVKGRGFEGSWQDWMAAITAVKDKQPDEELRNSGFLKLNDDDKSEVRAVMADVTRQAEALISHFRAQTKPESEPTATSIEATLKEAAYGDSSTTATSVTLAQMFGTTPAGSAAREATCKAGNGGANPKSISAVITCICYDNNAGLADPCIVTKTAGTPWNAGASQQPEPTQAKDIIQLCGKQDTFIATAASVEKLIHGVTNGITTVSTAGYIGTFKNTNCNGAATNGVCVEIPNYAAGQAAALKQMNWYIKLTQTLEQLKTTEARQQQAQHVAIQLEALKHQAKYLATRPKMPLAASKPHASGAASKETKEDATDCHKHDNKNATCPKDRCTYDEKEKKCNPIKTVEGSETPATGDGTAGGAAATEKCKGKLEPECTKAPECKWENNACKDSSILVNKKFALSVVSAAFVALLF
ncbi:variant surface glycoprotein (VSG), putative [Trypanosoma brucei brucei TREU927]|uniref:Variant surface glycoprotein (VSG), putative n=1 Tax=Trypanosoma brucei brucei (strain 927/4 GUTat10.1) TaxID=185431 RepID=Q380U7_TRYB2|nr:variant surface glycoprotein [Trypanosoma brucei brucei TREU927]EAN80684.1 variant surface glycoprotein (VSG), putative [Trypanosoma brucei brucei TREU927]